MGYNSIDPFVQLTELGGSAGTSILERKGGAVQVSNDGGATFGAIGLGAASIVTQPNSNAVQVNALELDTTLSTATAGAEVSRFVIKLLKAGAAANYYQFDPDTFTMSSGVAKIAFPNSSMFQDISLVNLNFTMFGDMVVGASGALATSATRGFLQIPTCAGTPSGSLAGLTTGKAAMVLDTTGSKLWLSSVAGTWKGVVIA
jgi:hypothetical protein